jgi:hypothetical protein
MKKLLILFIFTTLITSCITTDRVVSSGCNCDTNFRAWWGWNSPYLYNPWLYDLGWHSNWWFYNRYPRYYNRNTTPTPPPPSRYDRRRDSVPRTITPSQPQRRYYDDNVYPERRPTHRVPMTPSPRYSEPSNNTPSRNYQNQNMRQSPNTVPYRSTSPSINSTTPSRRSRGGFQ